MRHSCTLRLWQIRKTWAWAERYSCFWCIYHSRNYVWGINSRLSKGDNCSAQRNMSLQ